MPSLTDVNNSIVRSRVLIRQCDCISMYFVPCAMGRCYGTPLRAP